MSKVAKLFPLDVDSDGDKLIEEVMAVMCRFSEEKYKDITVFHHAMDIMRLFVHYEKTGEVKPFDHTAKYKTK